MELEILNFIQQHLRNPVFDVLMPFFKLNRRSGHRLDYHLRGTALLQKIQAVRRDGAARHAACLSGGGGAAQKHHRTAAPVPCQHGRYDDCRKARQLFVPIGPFFFVVRGGVHPIALREQMARDWCGCACGVYRVFQDVRLCALSV